MNKLALMGICSVLASSTLLAGCASNEASAGSGPVKVASIVDQTGPLSGIGIPMSVAADLAVKDINAKGGVLGRQLQLQALDGQTDIARYTVLARQVSRDPEIAVVQGGVSSASREAIRPVLGAAQKSGVQQSGVRRT